MSTIFPWTKNKISIVYYDAFFYIFNTYILIHINFLSVSIAGTNELQDINA